MHCQGEEVWVAPIQCWLPISCFSTLSEEKEEKEDDEDVCSCGPGGGAQAETEDDSGSLSGAVSAAVVEASAGTARTEDFSERNPREQCLSASVTHVQLIKSTTNEVHG